MKNAMLTFKAGEKLLLCFSLDRPGKPASEKTRDDIRRSVLYSHGLDLRPAIGVFEGKKENIFMVEVNFGFNYELSHIANIARRFQQDSILIVNASNEAFIHDLKSDKAAKIGRWRVAGPEHSESDRTLDLSTNTTYIVE